MAVAISMHNIVKNYGKVRALDELDLTVAQGEVHAFLGPNGAGKTTQSEYCSASSGPTAASPNSSASTHGPMRCPFIVALPTCQATWTCGFFAANALSGADLETLCARTEG